jgi:hypothetical protein
MARTPLEARNERRGKRACERGTSPSVKPKADGSLTINQQSSEWIAPTRMHQGAACKGLTNGAGHVRGFRKGG